MTKRTRADSPTKTCTVDGCARALRARGLCSTHYNQAHQPLRHAAKPTTCHVCGVTILRPFASDRRPVCSVRCRTILTCGYASHASGYDWARDAVTRARRAGAEVIDVFTREQVFTRDGWCCYLCGVTTDPTLSPFDPLSPTIDHVIPLSQGGQHSLANVRCACLHCNSRKQDRAA